MKRIVSDIRHFLKVGESMSEYKIMARVVDNGRIVGYQYMDKVKRVIYTCDTEDIKGIFTESEIAGLCRQELMADIELRTLDDRLRIDSIKPFKSNQTLALEFKAKYRLLGLDVDIDLDDRDYNKVALMNVHDKESTGAFRIPEFITSIKPEVFDGKAVFDGCKFTEIYVDNKVGRKIDLGRLCGNMESEHIKLVIKNPQEVVSLSRCFDGCSELMRVDLSDMDFSNCSGLNDMFAYCERLVDINFKNSKFSGVEDMSYMFYECRALKSIDISMIDTSKVTDMSFVFGDCRSLTKLDIRNFDTSNCITMNGMFLECNSLKNLDIKHFNTKAVEDFSSMFYECSSLEELDLSTFDVGNANDTGTMFSHCYNLKRLYLRWKNCKNIKVMGYMFAWCKNLEYLDLGELHSTDIDVTETMFKGCRLKQIKTIPEFIRIIKSINKK